MSHNTLALHPGVAPHLLFPLSRPTFTAALFSCVMHICALGWSNALMLTQGERALTPIKVAILQQAAPLPVGETEARGTSTPEPAAPPAPAPPPPVKPEPKVKKPQEKPLRPTPPLVKKPPPKTVTAPPTPELPPEPAAMTLPPDNGALAGGAEQDGGSTTNTGASGDSKRVGTGSRNEAEQRGVPGGTSARPDYGVNPKPPYPMLARRRGEQGIVLLRVHVRADGSVAAAEIKQSSGSTLLDDSALQTVRESWRFMPARLDGVPVESWVEVPIRFVLGNA